MLLEWTDRSRVLCTCSFVRKLLVSRVDNDEKYEDAVQVSRRFWIVFDENLLEVAGRHAHRRNTNLSELRSRH